MRTYVTGELFGAALAAAFGKGEFPKIHEAFPSLFDGVSQAEQSQLLQTARERIMAHQFDYKKNRVI